MAKRKTKQSEASAHDDYELPDEVDFGKTRFLGMGLQSLENKPLVQAKATMVRLDPENADEFPTADEVNEALRLMRIIRESVRLEKRRKSA